MRALAAIPFRLFAFVGKEVIETFRRPGAILSLVLGPFLIMAIFGLGYSGARRPLDTVVVTPPASGLPADAPTYQTMAGDGLQIVAVVGDRPTAEAMLMAGEADVLVIAPGDARARFTSGEQSVIDVVIDTVDPVASAYASFLAGALSSAVNRAIIERAAEEGQAYALAAGGSEAAEIPPSIIAEPTRAELSNVAPSTPGVVTFFGPAVLALILQHLAVSLIAMSLVRERTSGVIELFRIAPVSTAEVLIGKVVAFGLMGGAIALLTIGLMVAVLGIPALAGIGPILGAIGLLLLASLGLGLLIAVVSDSERQAVQLSLLVLLASVFFSGFVIAVAEFSTPVQVLAYALPVTSGIQLLQDLMLRGSTDQAWSYAVLGAIAAVTMTIAWIVLRRGMTRA